MQIVKSDRLHFLFIFLALLSVPCTAQEQPSQPLKLESAVGLALSNYPAIRAAHAQRQAAEAGVELARTNYLPRADVLWQQNRATRNNVFGLLLPQAVIPPISGPQLDSTSLESAWGSAGGLMLSWEPFDFGLRKANVDLARAIGRQANANEAVTRLDVSAAAADAFLTLLATEQTMEAAQAGVERAETLARAVRALVENQLRPGVDASRAGAELAAAKNLLIQAEQNAELARANLAETIGQGGTNITIDPGPLLELPPAPQPPEVNLALHPLAIAQTAAIDTSRSREKLLDRSWFPRFNWQTAVFGRGTGARLDGTFETGNGWRPNTFNWATGMTISFPVFDIFGLRSRRKVEANNTALRRPFTILVIVVGIALGSVLAITRMPVDIFPNLNLPVILEGALGALLTGLMVLLFLRDVRSALIVVATIPFAILAGVVGLWLTGQTINIMTLGGLALAVGILVDESTVAIENIHTHLSRGEPLRRAVWDATRETITPRLLAMLAVLAVFAPSLFMAGVARSLFVPLSLAVGFAMLASYFLSNTLVPALSAWLLKHSHAKERKQPFFDRIRARYEGLLDAVWRLRWIALAVYALIALAGIFLIGRNLGTDIFPQVDTGMFQLRLRAPTGTRAERTEVVALKALDTIKTEAGRRRRRYHARLYRHAARQLPRQHDPPVDERAARRSTCNRLWARLWPSAFPLRTRSGWSRSPNSAGEKGRNQSRRQAACGRS